MPIYQYRCENCGDFSVLHRLGRLLPECPTCKGSVRVVISEPQIHIRHGMKGDCRDYREDLARFPGDPEAYVDGPRSLQKLISKRKREGWEISKLSDAAPKERKLTPSSQVAKECVEEALRKTK